MDYLFFCTINSMFFFFLLPNKMNKYISNNMKDYNDNS